MKIFIICSKNFYGMIPPIKESLENRGYEVVLPNCYDEPDTEAKYRGTEEHKKFKAAMFKQSEETIKSIDCVLVINETKNGIENYIGGATFLEMYDAFRLGKTIYLLNDIPEGLLKDEIIGFSPIVINRDLEKIEEQETEIKRLRIKS